MCCQCYLRFGREAEFRISLLNCHHTSKNGQVDMARFEKLAFEIVGEFPLNFPKMAIQ